MHQVYQVETGSSKAVLSRPGALLSVNLAAGSAAATVTIYDNTSAAGEIVAIVKATSNNSRAWELPAGGISLKVGAYVVVTGTGASAFVVVR